MNELVNDGRHFVSNKNMIQQDVEFAGTFIFVFYSPIKANLTGFR